MENGEGVFAHNVQSVRILSSLESNGKGKNISIQVLDAILCHNGELLEEEYYPVVKTKEQFIEEYNDCYTDLSVSKKLRPMTLEGCVVRISDIIAYAGKDVEDAVRLGIITEEDVPDDIVNVLGKNITTLHSLMSFNYERIYHVINAQKEVKAYEEMYEALFYSYKKALDSSNTSNDNAVNSVEKNLANIYSVAGVSPQLFSTDSNLSLETSINNDMALMMIFARKLERLMTFIINNEYGNSNISFKYTILPITFYNERKYGEEALKLANSGYSFILPALAIGLSQRELGNIKDLENDVLGLKEKLIPLSTSYTESAGNPGRPELPAEEKSAKTIANEKSLDGGGSNTNG